MEDEIRIGGKADIDEALREFEAKSKREQAQRSPEQNKSQAPRVVQATMKLSQGRIKSETEATYALLAFVILALGLSLFLFLRGGEEESEISVPKGYKIIYPENAPPRLERQL